MLWAWEVPEDLSTLDPTRAGVAFLSRELLLSNNPASTILVRPRHQPLRVAPGVFLMAVTRIETAPGFIPAPAMAANVARAIAATRAQPNVRALQVDFDATPAQQAFYADVLRQLRTLLPAAASALHHRPRRLVQPDCLLLPRQLARRAPCPRLKPYSRGCADVLSHGRARGNPRLRASLPRCPHRTSLLHQRRP